MKKSKKSRYCFEHNNYSILDRLNFLSVKLGADVINNSGFIPFGPSKFGTLHYKGAFFTEGKADPVVIYLCCVFLTCCAGLLPVANLGIWGGGL